MSETLLRFELRTVLIKSDKEVGDLGQFLQINLPSAALLRLDAVHMYHFYWGSCHACRDEPSLLTSLITAQKRLERCNNRQWRTVHIGLSINRGQIYISVESCNCPDNIKKYVVLIDVAKGLKRIDLWK